MESMRDIDRAMEREIAKGSCPLKFVGIEFGDSPYQEIASKERLLAIFVNVSYLLAEKLYVLKLMIKAINLFQITFLYHS